MNGKQLKNSILQWAIQGKLVPQDPNDEPAFFLLEKIRAEKERLVKEKKIKKDKNESIIFRGDDNSYYEKFLATGEVKCIDEEIPFEIPKGWEWCRLRDVIMGTNAGKSPNCEKRPKRGEEWGVLTTTAIQENDFLPNENKVLPPNYSVNSEHSVKYGDILITRAGPVNRTGIVCLVDKECDNLILSDKTVRIDYFRNYCNPTFIVLVLNSPAIHELLMSVTVGMAASQVNVSQGNIQNTLIPFPGIKEQNRIAVKITNLLPIIERYNSEQEQLEELNAQLPSSLKKSLLQEAIQGKLVPQIESEGTAGELLSTIRKEKENLVKQGKLKKSSLSDSFIFKGDDNKYYEQIGKKCLDITEQITFEIPVNWAWARMGQIGDWGAGSTPQRGNANYYNGNILWLKTGELNNGIVYDTEEKITQKAFQDCSLRMNKIGDVLIAMYGATIGKLAIVGKDLTTNQACCGCTPYLIYNWYLFYFLMASRDSFIKKGEGGAQPNISRVKLVEHLIPLPPLKEQHRIVAQIEKLFEQLR